VSSDERVITTSHERRFPEGFLWGTATSSHQVEGDDARSDWAAWEAQPGRIHDGTRAGRACEWWAGRAEEDLDRARAMGHGAIRLSLEWSRLERAPGDFDEVAFDRYAQILERARSLGLTAMVGLNHFTLPAWLAAQGGWLAPGAVDRFARYADRCARRLGALVPRWATLNEPSVLAFMGYLGTQWPPGLGRPLAGMRALRAQLLAHAAAWHAIHDVDPDARAGLVLNMPALDPADPSRRRDRAVAAAQDWAFTGVVLDALRHGRFRAPLAIATEPAPALRDTLDFVGLNYYGRYRVSFDPTRPAEMFGRRSAERTVHTEHNDWGEIHPEGLTRQLLRLARTFPRVPLFVTENGMYDPTDAQRPAYLESHVRAVHDAIARGADVRGYFAWSLVDNFEWAEGWSTPFGLLALDRETQARTPRRSAEVFSVICRANAVRPGP
jgi:beta-glucosidase